MTGGCFIGLGLKPGPRFKEIIDECNNLPDEEAFARAKVLAEEEKAKAKPKNDQAHRKVVEDSALEFLLNFPWCPSSREGDLCSKASNSEKRRWLENKAVIINGQKPGPDDIISFPIEQLVFFPNGKSKTTMM